MKFDAQFLNYEGSKRPDSGAFQAVTNRHGATIGADRPNTKGSLFHHRGARHATILGRASVKRRCCDAFIMVLVVLASISTARAQDWGGLAVISSTMGVNANRLCVGEASRGDIGCPSYAPYVAPSGNIGIGTATPSTTLHVVGRPRFTASSGGFMLDLSDPNSPSGNRNWSFVDHNDSGFLVIKPRYDDWSSVSDSRFIGIQHATGNMILGAVSPPNVKLQVSGTIQMADGGETCISTRRGAIKYWSGDFWLCRNGSTWESLASIADGASAGDRITSGSQAGVIANSTGYISVTTGGVTDRAYFTPLGVYVGGGVSTTGGISGTTGYFGGQVYINALHDDTSGYNLNVSGTVGVSGTGSFFATGISPRIQFDNVNGASYWMGSPNWVGTDFRLYSTKTSPQSIMTVKDMTTRIGFWTGAPNTTVDISGTVRLADGGEPCDTSRKGAIKYTGGDFYVCRNGTAWESLSSVANNANSDRITSGTTQVITKNNTSVSIVTAGTERVVVGTTGEVGIGQQPSAGVGLAVSGSFTVTNKTTSGLTFYTYSSNTAVLNITSSAAYPVSVLNLSNPTQGWQLRNQDNIFSIFNANTASYPVNVVSSGKVGIGTTNPSSTLSVNGEIASLNYSEGGNIRMIGGTYGALLRNDGSNLYTLLTNSGDPYGTWNNLRPFFIKLATGNVFVGQQLTVGTSTANDPSTTFAVIGSLRVSAESSSTMSTCDANRTGAIKYQSGDFYVCRSAATGWESLTAVASAGTPDRITSGTTQVIAKNNTSVSIVTAGTERMVIGTNGYIGVYQQPGFFPFMVSGTIYGNTLRTSENTVNTGGNFNSIELGSGVSTNKTAYIDLVGDTTYSDYGLRLIRGSTGADTSSTLEHRGKGDLIIRTDEIADTVFQTHSIERMRIDSSGNVGIGTASPSYPLDVNGNISAKQMVLNSPSGNYRGLTVKSDGLNRWQVAVNAVSETGNDEGSDFYIQKASDDGTWGSSFLTFKRSTLNTNLPAGSVGIRIGNYGTPSTTLHVNGSLRLAAETSSTMNTCDANRAGAIKYTGGDFYVCRNGTAWESLTSVGGGSSDRIISGTTQAIAYTNTSLSLVTAGKERMVIGTTGNVGIGQQPGSVALAVSGTGQFATFGNPSLVDQYMSIRSLFNGLTLGLTSTMPDSNGAGIIQSGSNKGLAFIVSATTFAPANPSLYITNLGKIGVGTTSPQADMHIQNGSSGQTFSHMTGLVIENNGTADDFYALQVATGTGKILTVANSGKIGVSTTTPRTTLDVNGSLRVGVETSSTVGTCDANRLGAMKYTVGDFYVCRSAATGWESLTSIGGTSDRIVSGSTQAIAYKNTSLSLVTAGIERVVIGANGNVGIGQQPASSALNVSGSLQTALGLYSAASPYTYPSFWAWNGVNTGGLFMPYGYLGSNGSFRSSWMWNGFRNNSDTWTSLGVNGYAGAMGIEMGNDGIKFLTTSSSLSGVSVTSPPARMTIDPSGNVGIGTTNPSTALDVGNGAIRIGSRVGSETSLTDAVLTRQGAYIGWNEDNGLGRTSFMNQRGIGGGGFDFSLYNNSGAFISTPVTINGSGNVGIGTTTPSTTLHVNGAGRSYVTLLMSNDLSGTTSSIVQEEGRYFHAIIQYGISGRRRCYRSLCTQQR